MSVYSCLCLSCVYTSKILASSLTNKCAYCQAPDCHVNEGTQQAFEQLVLKVHHSLYPFLKSLMGHWLLAQCDTYTHAASAA